VQNPPFPSTGTGEKHHQMKVDFNPDNTHEYASYSETSFGIPVEDFNNFTGPGCQEP
ncbi:hypothetical protein A2U01_0013153, partial [Trifolium medium]|nr:hypothetical protein [Trifolium medium]